MDFHSRTDEIRTAAESGDIDRAATLIAALADEMDLAQRLEFAARLIEATGPHQD
ncbi:hypothetical protein [Nocardiopsis sp. NPDC006938]|uniref:hypothetical protein n=1 Tax=Nocardiopsis sp. NPDC006938 TaxID=3364337 RepID=UPI0036BC3FFF